MENRNGDTPETIKEASKKTESKPMDDMDTSHGRDQGLSIKQEDTRSKVAILIILGFFAVVFVSFIIPIVLKDTSDLRELLSTIMGGLAGIVGFVVGHYFKH